MKDNGTSAGIEKMLVSRAMTPEELTDARNKFIELKEQQDDLMRQLAIITASIKGQIKPIAEKAANLLATIRRKNFNIEENCEKVFRFSKIPPRLVLRRSTTRDCKRREGRRPKRRALRTAFGLRTVRR